jgi:thymidine kinase
MEVSTQFPSLDIIIGAMYSGKTTEIMRRLHIFQEMGYNCLYINSILDTRNEDEVLSTHNPTLKVSKKIDMIKYNILPTNIESISVYDVIGIDEAQFIPNLKDTVLKYVEEFGKKVIIGGLNGDFQRNKFGEVLDLIPYCDQIIKLQPFCLPCSKRDRKMVPALFSKRIVHGENDTQQVLIGALEAYVPACRKCYLD